MNKRSMKEWDYQGQTYTTEELSKHPDCVVTLRELQINLVRKKHKVEIAIKTRIGRSEKVNTYSHHGLDLTLREIADLTSTEVSYWKLCKNLRDGHPLEEAIKKKPKPLQKKVKKVQKYIKTELKSTLEEIGSPYSKAQGSQIKISNQEISKYRPELSWDYMAAKKLNALLEARKSEVELAKYLNEEDCTRTKN